MRGANGLLTCIPNLTGTKYQMKTTMTEKVLPETTSTYKGQTKVRDEFLADLIREFGAEHGTELYQSRRVTKQELARFIVLLKKFKIAATMPLQPQQQQFVHGNRRW